MQYFKHLCILLSKTLIKNGKKVSSGGYKIVDRRV